MIIETNRLVLRAWLDKDIESFYRIHQDSKMMKFLSGPTTYSETEQFVNRAMRQIKVFGFGRFACEYKENRELIGFIGLNIPLFEASFTPCVELGFRIAPEYWGLGLATEGAKSVLKYAFEQIKLSEVISYTHENNV